MSARRSSARASPGSSRRWATRSIRDNHLGDWGCAVRYDPLGLEAREGRRRPTRPDPVAELARGCIRSVQSHIKAAGEALQEKCASQGLRPRRNRADPPTPRRSSTTLYDGTGLKMADVRAVVGQAAGTSSRTRRPPGDGQAPHRRPRESSPLWSSSSCPTASAASAGDLRPPRRRSFDVQLGESLSTRSARCWEPALDALAWNDPHPKLARSSTTSCAGSRHPERGGHGRLHRRLEDAVPRAEERRGLQLRHDRLWPPSSTGSSDLESRPRPLRGRPSPGGPLQEPVRRVEALDGLEARQRLEHIAFGTVLGQDRQVPTRPATAT